MQMDRLTIKAQEALQAALNLAHARRHAQVLPEHLLAVLLERRGGDRLAVLLGLVAETARAAVPRHGVFSSLSAWFISPGRGAALECRARIVHQGRSFAVVRVTPGTSDVVKPTATARYHVTLQPEGTLFTYQFEVRNPNRSHQPFVVRLGSGEHVQTVDTTASAMAQSDRSRI